MTRYLAPLFVLAMPIAAFAADDAHAEPNVFAGTIAQSIAAAIVFLILFAVLYKKAWGPILSGLQDRETKIKNDLEQAEKAAGEAKQTLAAYKEQLSSAQEEAKRVIDQARSDAQKIAAQLKSDSEKEFKQMRDRATADIAAAKEQAVNDIYNQTASIATSIASRIIRREINEADQDQLVRDSLAELGNVNKN